MKRLVMDKLIEWKSDKYRKPLILKGARQVGKTWLLQEFGKNNYDNVAYFNFDYDIRLKDIFENTKDPNRIIEQLTFINKDSIKKEKTLIIFDEIQECPNALNSLKYFYEMEPDYHVACAGSLLGIRLSHTSFPVGKVNFIDVYPMTFTEFLEADDSSNLVSYMNSVNKIEKIPSIFFERIIEKLKVYFVIGGMPSVVSIWLETKDINKVEKAIDEILYAYEQDFSKHADKNEANKISQIWQSIPSQLAKENKKFLYQVIKEGARAREYEVALNWLNDANIIEKVYRVNGIGLPLVSYNDLSAFKIYLNDIGLLRRKANLDSSILVEGNKLFIEFKGALAENFILSHLRTVFSVVNYYTFNNYEIDFLIQNRNEIIPIEVKSGNNINSTSLNKYNEQNHPKYRIRFSMNNFSIDGNLINIPLFMVEYVNKILMILE